MIKKTIKILMICIITNSFATPLQAQEKPYKAAIGGIIGNGTGASFKMFFTPNLTFGADLYFKITPTFGRVKEHSTYYFIPDLLITSTEVNPYLAYQETIKQSDIWRLDWLAGGGLSLGYAYDGGGKFGINAIAGLEFVFKKIPLSIQLDIRPGYGLTYRYYNDNYFLDNQLIKRNFATHSYFDWGIGVSLRYRF